MSDIKTECFYKQGEHMITFNENYIKIGTHNISTKNVYHINISYITNYEKLYKIATVVTSAVATTLLFALFENRINILAALVVSFIVSIYSYVIKPKKKIKQNPNKFIKLIDIFHNDKHEAIVVKSGFNIDVDKYCKLKKTMIRNRVLRHYLSRMKESRKYLVNQIEIGQKVSVGVIYEKYATVASHRYRQENIYSKRTIEVLTNSYNEILGKDIKLSLKISTITIIMLIALAIHVALSDDFVFRSFF